MSRADPHPAAHSLPQRVEGRVRPAQAAARTVVGQDEPSDGFTHEDAAVEHWTALVQDLAEHEVVVGPVVLAALPHDVDHGPRLRAQLGI